MYQPTILKSILVNRDYKALIKCQDKKKSIFTNRDYSTLFSLITTLSNKNNEIPSDEYFHAYFQAEKTSQTKEFYHSLMSDNGIKVVSGYDLITIIDDQIKNFVKQEVSHIIRSNQNEFKLADLSTIPDKLTTMIDELYDKYRLLETTNDTEGVLFHDTTSDNVNHIKAQIIKDYELRSSGSQGYYKFNTGINSIDQIIGGIHSVEFMGILGYVKNGKSYLCRQIAYNVLCQGKNVAFITLEMSYESIVHCFMSLHANNINAWGWDTPKIKTADIRSGTLTEKAWDFYKNKVIDDFMTSDDMGSLFIKQPTDHEYTPEKLFADIRNKRQEMDIDLLVIDYPTLMHTTSGIRDRQSYNELFRQIRHFGLTQQIPILFPIQSNRAGYDKALKDKEHLYSPDAIGDYSSIEREATNIISIITSPDLRQTGQSQIQHLISRESDLFKPFLLSVDFETGVMSEVEQIAQEDKEQILEEIDI